MNKGYLAQATLLLILPLSAQASFIESSIGTAVVNDATASYYNPAALIAVKQPQIIGLGSMSSYRSGFTGQSIQAATGFTQSGSTTSHTNYWLPSLYFGMAATPKVSLGVAIVSNFFNKDVEENSILRYAESSNKTKNVDFVPAIGIQINDYVSVGAGVNFSYADLTMRPVSGVPSLNIPDNQSLNKSDGTGIGGDVGILVKASPSTVIGFNYRSSITYSLSGTSELENHPEARSNHYHFQFWTPARSVLSINHFVTPKLGFIGTVQRIQWDIFQNLHIDGIATQIGNQPVTVNATVPYHLHNTWVFTLGSHYRITPKWIVRIAGTYNQSAGNNHYQISNGDSIVLGISSGYEINKRFKIDGSYAHGFIQSQNIHISTGKNRIQGVSSGHLDAVSLKLTMNLA